MGSRGLKWAVAVGMVSLVAVVGCSSSSDSSSSTCKDLQDLASEVRGLQNVDLVQSGVDGLKQQTDAIQQAWTQAKESGDDQFGSQLDALETSIKALSTTLSDAVSGGQSISSVLSAVSTDVEQVSTAWSDLTDAVNAELSGCDLSG